MSMLLSDDLKRILARLRGQELEKDPTVYTAFVFACSGWKWLVTEGEASGDDFIFFGYVIGFEAEFGSFALSELEELNTHGVENKEAANG